mmetsp:Transcript_41067/g.114137  ORF Transcript_41067/g.114137 Transcript_41067/m.114137 type:complete len:114 (-) Transcript_41067:248-589(-)
MLRVLLSVSNVVNRLLDGPYGLAFRLLYVVAFFSIGVYALHWLHHTLEAATIARGGVDPGAECPHHKEQAQPTDVAEDAPAKTKARLRRAPHGRAELDAGASLAPPPPTERSQ